MSSAMTILATRDPETSIALSRGESIGLMLDTLAGLASALASAFVLDRIFVSLRFARIKRSETLPSAAYGRMGGQAWAHCISP